MGESVFYKDSISSSATVFTARPVLWFLLSAISQPQIYVSLPFESCPTFSLCDSENFGAVLTLSPQLPTLFSNTQHSSGFWPVSEPPGLFSQLNQSDRSESSWACFAKYAPPSHFLLHSPRLEDQYPGSSVYSLASPDTSSRPLSGYSLAILRGRMAPCCHLEHKFFSLTSKHL